MKKLGMEGCNASMPLEQTGKIVEKHNSLLASKKDQEIFFEAIMNPQQPNDRLKAAANSYNKSARRK